MEIQNHLYANINFITENNESDDENEVRRFNETETEEFWDSLFDMPLDLRNKAKNSRHIFGFEIFSIKNGIITKNIKSLELEDEGDALMNIESLVKEWKEENRFMIDRLDQIVPIKRRGAEFFISQENI